MTLHERAVDTGWAKLVHVELGPVRKILTHLSEPLQPPPVSPAREPPTDSGELAEAHDDVNIVQIAPDVRQVASALPLRPLIARRTVAEVPLS